MIRMSLVTGAIVGSAMLMLVSPASAARLIFENATPTLRGQSSDVCLALAEGEGEIAGLQTNLVWDDRCITPANGQRPCLAAAESGKTVQARLQGPGELKAIVISFADTNPIPDGRIFCCSFTAVGNPGERCVVTASRIIGATATGMRIDGIQSANNAVVAIPVEGTFEPPPFRTATVRGEVSDDGCVIRESGPGSGASYLHVLTSVTLLLAWARRRRVQAPN
jgi:hypothetical protein